MQILVEVEGESVTLLPSREEELMLITASQTSVENLFEHGKCTCVAPAFGTQIKMNLTKSIANPTTGAHMVLYGLRHRMLGVDTNIWTHHRMS